MAVTLRMKREGSKDRPFYKIVATDSRKRRDCRPIELLGSYDPALKGENYKIDLERADYWLSNGAQTSDTVASIIKKARKAQAASA